MKKSRPAKSVPKVQTQDESLLAQMEALAEMLGRHELSEIEVEQGGVRLRLRRGPEGVSSAAPTMISAPTAIAPAPAQPAGGAPSPGPTTGPNRAETSDGNVSYITSPFVGTFYRSPGPDSAPFVDVGTRIKKGQVLCIVEAMKLMNEIECEIDGVVVQCLVENGNPVEYGEPLFKVKQG